LAYVSPPNSGVITRNAEQAGDEASRTLIVTGVARSGTSMLSAVLQTAGFFMGEHLYSIVGEDAEMLAILQAGNETLLRNLIQDRNSKHQNWGFKIPNLHVYMTVRQLSWFRNPYLIVICRDPVAVAVRNALSEHYDPLESFQSTAHALSAFGAFAQAAPCPVLMLSYEKAITAPGQTLEALLSFCGITPDPDLKLALLQAIRPNNPDYLAVANSEYRGFVDSFRNGKLLGWCWRVGSLAPVLVDIYADDVLLTSVIADQYRADLADNQIGNGNHSFIADLSACDLNTDTVLRVRVRDRTVELRGSGRRIHDIATVAA
jgi:hypothetical protein